MVAPQMNDVVVSLLIAVVAAIPGVYALIANRRKTQAESNSIEVGALRDTVTSLRADYSQICQSLDELERRYKEVKEDLEGALSEQAAASRAFTKLQQDFLEVERAKEFLQIAVVERDKRITALEAQSTVDRAKIAELEAQVMALTQKVNGNGSL